METPEEVKEKTEVVVASEGVMARVGQKPLKDPSQIVISIPKSYDFLKGEMLRLAHDEDRSLSNYLVLVMAKHVADKGGITK